MKKAYEEDLAVALDARTAANLQVQTYLITEKGLKSRVNAAEAETQRKADAVEEAWRNVKEMDFELKETRKRQEGVCQAYQRQKEMDDDKIETQTCEIIELAAQKVMAEETLVEMQRESEKRLRQLEVVSEKH